MQRVCNSFNVRGECKWLGQCGASHYCLRCAADDHGAVDCALPAPPQAVPASDEPSLPATLRLGDPATTTACSGPEPPGGPSWSTTNTKDAEGQQDAAADIGPDESSATAAGSLASYDTEPGAVRHTSLPALASSRATFRALWPF